MSRTFAATHDTVLPDPLRVHRAVPGVIRELATGTMPPERQRQFAGLLAEPADVVAAHAGASDASEAPTALAVLATMAAPVLLISALIARDGWRHRQERRGRRPSARPGRHRLAVGRAEATSGRRPDADESTPEAISARLAGVADELAETEAGLRRAVDEGTVPPSTMALVVRFENVVARMRRPSQPTAPESERSEEET